MKAKTLLNFMSQDLTLGLTNKNMKLNLNRQGITKLKWVQTNTHVPSYKTIETFLPQSLGENTKFENWMNGEI